MTRYYLEELSIEGFRGINNEGNPLKIRFQPDAVNSIHAPNGLGKTSIFEAIHYAIFDEVPRLSTLQQAERPTAYINNRFHSTGLATISLIFRADDGSPNVEIVVQRTRAGARSATSPTGYPDPDGFLQSLREDFVLVDYAKFAKFIDSTALVRGRSFAALVGLSRYSSFRQTLEGAKDTRSLNTDLNILALQTEIANGERQVADGACHALGAYTEITGQTAVDLSNVDGLCAVVTRAIREIALLNSSMGPLRNNDRQSRRR